MPILRLPRPAVAHPTWSWPLLAAVAAFYLLTRQHIFTIDSLYYLWNVEHADWRTLLHPHRLAVEPLLRGWWRLWQVLGWSDNAVLPVQVLSTLVTVAALALGGRLLVALTRTDDDDSTRPSAWTVLGGWWLLLAVSYLPWHQATQAEGLPLFLLASTASLLWAVQLAQRPTSQPPGVRTALGLCALITGSVLVHQSLVLWAPLLAVMLARQAPTGRRLQLAAIALLPAATLVAGSYVIAGLFVLGSGSLLDVARWSTGYAEEFSGRCGSLNLLFSTDILRGLSAAFLTGIPLKPYVYGYRGFDLMLAFRLLPFALVGAILLAGLMQLPRALGAGAPPARRRAAVNVLVLLVVGGLFAGWWEPANRKFWAPVLPGLIALAALGWQVLVGRRPSGTSAAPFAIALVVLATNLVGAILPGLSRHDANQPLLRFLDRQLRAQDTVILAESRPWQCALYFRPALPVHGIPGAWSGRDDPGRTVFHIAVAAARRSLQDGGDLYVSACQWPDVARALTADLGSLPAPEPVLVFVDEDRGLPLQTLLLVQAPRLRAMPAAASQY